MFDDTQPIGDSALPAGPCSTACGVTSGSIRENLVRVARRPQLLAEDAAVAADDRVPQLIVPVPGLDQVADAQAAVRQRDRHPRDGGVLDEAARRCSNVDAVVGGAHFGQIGRSAGISPLQGAGQRVTVVDARRQRLAGPAGARFSITLSN